MNDLEEQADEDPVIWIWRAADFMEALEVALELGFDDEDGKHVDGI